MPASPKSSPAVPRVVTSPWYARCLVLVGVAGSGPLGCASSDGQSQEVDGESSSSTGVQDDVPHTVLLATVSNTLCDGVGVVGAQLQAVQVGCESPPPAPCTMPADPPPILGDLLSCPITDPEVTLGVRIERAARYQVEVVADRAPEAPTSECFAETTMATSVLVTGDDLDAHATKMLVGTGTACPLE